MPLISLYSENRIWHLHK